MDLPNASFDVVLCQQGRAERQAGTPVAPAVGALDDEKRAALARQVKVALQPYANGDGVAVPEEVNIAIAHK